MQPVGQLVRRNIGPSEDSPVAESVQAQIRRVWGRCAGNAAAASFPLLFASGRLVVYTRSSIWANELRHRQATILDALDRFGATRMEVRATPAPLSPPRPDPRTVRISTTNQKGISITARNIRHPGLRSAVERLARRAAGEVESD